MNGQILRAVAWEISENRLTDEEARLKNERHGFQLGTHKVVLTAQEMDEALEIAAADERYTVEGR